MKKVTKKVTKVAPVKKVAVKPKSNVKMLMWMLAASLVLLALVLMNVNKSQDTQGSAKGKKGDDPVQVGKARDVQIKPLTDKEKKQQQNTPQTSKVTQDTPSTQKGKVVLPDANLGKATNTDNTTTKSTPVPAGRTTY